MKRLGPATILRSMRGLMLRYMPFMITCRQFEDFLIDYLEGSLPDDKKMRFEVHLKVCGSCRAYLAAYRRAAEVSAKAVQMEEAEELPDAPEDLIKAVIDARCT